MAPSKRQAYTFFSAVYLVALTGFAIYALHKIRTHNLPIPTTLGAFALALPAVAGLILEALTGTGTSQQAAIKWAPGLGSKHTLSQYATTLLFIYETALATLAGTYITPASGVRCDLDTRWRKLYQAKNGEAIRRIQDAFQCCGLHSTLDMAFPFPSKDRGADACVKMHDGRKWSCFDEWREEERAVAGVILAVTAGVAAWKVSTSTIEHELQAKLTVEGKGLGDLHADAQRFVV
jgi:hypothetical protein